MMSDEVKTTFKEDLISILEKHKIEEKTLICDEFMADQIRANLDIWASLAHIIKKNTARIHEKADREWRANL